MANYTLTSANSIFTMWVPGLLPPVVLSGYSTDKAWETDANKLGEKFMGVDGKSSSGYTPNLYKQTVHIQGDSFLSKEFFGTIVRATKSAVNTYDIYATISLPSTGEVVNCTRGTLTEYVPMPSAGKVLEAMVYTIEWESMDLTIF